MPELDLEGLEAGAATTANPPIDSKTVVAEPKTPTETTEGVPVVKQPTTEPPDKQYYTAEEMRTLDPTNVDTSRIPPEQLPFYKSLQSGWNRKYEELAEMRKQVPQGQPATIEEAFDRDPPGLMMNIDRAISAKKMEAINQRFTDPEKSSIAEMDALKLEELRTNLAYRGMAKNNMETQERNILNDTFAGYKDAIPNYDKTWKDLERFAVEDLGYSIEEINVLIDPRRIGKEASVKTVKNIYSLYTKTYPQKAIKGNLDRTATKVQSTGSGFKDSGSEGRINAAKKKAESGNTEDIAAYLKVKQEEKTKNK